MRPVVASSRDDARQSSSPTPHEVREALEALLASPHLDASDRRRAFLRYIVEETLAGRADRLKGYSVAISVFGRDESFDSNTDPVVRLEARRLRRDLDSYYVDAGSRDRVRITIPKGAYVPSFEWNDRGAGGPRPAPAPSRWPCRSFVSNWAPTVRASGGTSSLGTSLTCKGLTSPYP